MRVRCIIKVNDVRSRQLRRKVPSGRDLTRSSQRWMAAKSWRKKYSDLSGSSVICCCEPAKVVGSDSEQEIEEYLIKPLTLIIEIIEQNQSFYVY